MADRLTRSTVVDKPDMHDKVDRVDYSRHAWQYVTWLAVVDKVDRFGNSRQGWQWLTRSTGLTRVDKVDIVDRR